MQTKSLLAAVAVTMSPWISVSAQSSFDLESWKLSVRGQERDLSSWKSDNPAPWNSYHKEESLECAEGWFVTVGPLGFTSWFHDRTGNQGWTGFEAHQPEFLRDEFGLLFNVIEVRNIHTDSPSAGLIEANDYIVSLDGEFFEAGPLSFANGEYERTGTWQFQPHVGNLIDDAQSNGTVKVGLLRLPEGYVEQPLSGVRQLSEQGRHTISAANEEVLIDYDVSGAGGFRIKKLSGSSLKSSGTPMILTNLDNGDVVDLMEYEVMIGKWYDYFGYIAEVPYAGNWKLSGGVTASGSAEFAVEFLSKAQLPASLQAYYQEVDVPLDAVGSFGENYDPNGEKAENMRKMMAHRLASHQEDDGSWHWVVGYSLPAFHTSICGLALMAENDPQYAEHIKKAAMYVAAPTGQGRENWSYTNGIQLSFLAEYYLRTRDPEVLPGLQRQYRRCRRYIQADYTAGHKERPGYGGSGWVGGGAVISMGMAVMDEAGVLSAEGQDILDQMMARVRELARTGTPGYGRSKPKYFDDAKDHGHGCMAVPHYVAAKVRGGNKAYVDACDARFAYPKFGSEQDGHATQTMHFMFGALGVAIADDQNFIDMMNYYRWRFTIMPDHLGLVGKNNYATEFHGGDGAVGYPFWTTASYLLMLNAHKHNLAMTGMAETYSPTRETADLTMEEREYYNHVFRSWSLADEVLGEMAPSGFEAAIAELRGITPVPGEEFLDSIRDWHEGKVEAVAAEILGMPGDPEGGSRGQIVELLFGFGIGSKFEGTALELEPRFLIGGFDVGNLEVEVSDGGVAMADPLVMSVDGPYGMVFDMSAYEFTDGHTFTIKVSYTIGSTPVAYEIDVTYPIYDDRYPNNILNSFEIECGTLHDYSGWAYANRLVLDNGYILGTEFYRHQNNQCMVRGGRYRARVALGNEWAANLQSWEEIESSARKATITGVSGPGDLSVLGDEAVDVALAVSSGDIFTFTFDQAREISEVFIAGDRKRRRIEALVDGEWKVIREDDGTNLMAIVSTVSDQFRIVFEQSGDFREVAFYGPEGAEYGRGSSWFRNASEYANIDTSNMRPMAMETVLEVAENLAVGSEVGQLLAVDMNEGDVLEYEIKIGNLGGYFSVDAATGVVSLDKPLDYDVLAEHRLTFEVRDQSGLAASAALIVQVSDVVELPEYVISLAENTEVGEVFGQLTTDLVSGDLVWEISDVTPVGSVSINEATGELTALVRYDYEQSAPVIQANVLALDGDGVRYETTLVVNITDVADDDSDTDGLDDGWELANFGGTALYDGAADVDNDGFTNAEEWELGTDPVDASYPNRFVNAGATDGNICDPANWSAGVVPVAGVGYISVDTKWWRGEDVANPGTGSTSSGGNILNDYHLVITDGTLIREANFIPEWTDCIIELRGGNLSSDGEGNRVFRMSGDTIITVGEGSLFEVDSTQDKIEFQNDGVGKARIVLDGGTLDVGTLSVSSAAEAYAFLEFAEGGGSALIDTITINVVGPYVNFVSGTEGTLTMNGASSATFQALWDAGQLRVDGVNSGNFSDQFDVIGSSLSLKEVIPAPVLDDRTLVVSENTAVGGVLGTMAASSSTGSLQWALNDDAGGLFSIDSASGEVRHTGALDYETAESHTIIVALTDDSTLSDTAAVIINVTDVNEAPVASDASGVIAENGAVNQAVATVLVSDPDANDSHSFSITAGNEEGAFSVDSNGSVQTTKALDYEGASQYTLTVVATDSGGLSDSATVLVDVSNVNEAPTLANVSGSIQENVGAGAVVLTLVANDPDVDSAFSYTLESGSGFIVDSGSGEVRSSVMFDYESTTQQVLTVRVSDEGGLSATATVTIDILNVNEAPVLADASVSLAEDALVGTSVVTLSGSDIDAGDSMTYSIVSGSGFSIDGATGEITTTTALDYETSTQHVLGVSVTDAGGLSDTAVVTVNVTDVLEVNEFIAGSLNDPANWTNGVLPSAEEAGLVGNDGTLNSSLTDFDLLIESGTITRNENAIYQWLGDTDIVIAGGVLDYTASSAAGNTHRVLRLKGSSSLTLQSGSLVLWNDRAFEMFDNGQIVMEGGSLVGGNITDASGYAGGAAVTFGQGDGSVSLLGSGIQLDEGYIDFETGTGGSLTVAGADAVYYQSLWDSGVLKLDGTNEVAFAAYFEVNGETLTLRGTPLSAPVLDVAEFYMLENSEAGTEVGILSPSNSTGDLVWELLDDAGGQFSIDANGRVTSASEFDYESQSVYSLVAQVSDASSLSGSATVTVFITNVNEAPVASDTSDSVAEDATTGTLVASVVGTDVDAGTSLSYSIVSGNVGGAFSIASNGEITTASGLDYETTASYNLTVEVSDGVLSDTAQVFVNVSNVNEAPVANDTSGSVAEDATVGTLVASVVGTDVDDGTSLSYSIVSGNVGGAFSIASNGEITTASGLDYETTASYGLTVEVSDGALSDTAQVFVNVTDVLEVTEPVIATGSATNLTMTEADLAYTVSDEGDEAPSVTLYYGETDGGQTLANWEHSLVLGIRSVGSYTESISGLEEGTSYYFTVAATNSAGKTWGSTGSFSTEADTSPKMVRTTVSDVSSATWTTVDLGKNYNSAVIVATPIYADSTQSPVVTRIRNVSGNSFELKLDRADNLTTETTCDVSIIAVEEGVYTLAGDGIQMEAVKFTSTVTAASSNWLAESRAYQNSYTTPVVLGQVMSYNDSGWSVFLSYGASATAIADASSLHITKCVGDDSSQTRADEQIGYIVIESGGGSLNGVNYVAGVGARTVRGPDNSSNGYSYTFSGLSNPSAAVVCQTGQSANDGSWAVLLGDPAVTANTITMLADEDQMKDSERRKYAENVSYIVFE
ncbi:cadherin domain-containing protein [Rubritalea tangerina]|uniref:Cadherin domain-containing protein n=1 Tax=Rubritalea tangerina TaxID=430798 RepID=A0ABW4Z9G2_9BACT